MRRSYAQVIGTALAGAVISTATFSGAAFAANPAGSAPVGNDEPTAAQLRMWEPSTMGNPISRDDVIARAKTWAGTPYSQAVRKGGYRTDCSGFVSMALNVNANDAGGFVTQNIAQIGERLGSYNELKPGDFMNWDNPNPNQDGHVVIFDHWIGAVGGDLMVYEQAGDTGWVNRKFGYDRGSYLPYRYKRIVDSSAPAVPDAELFATYPDGRLYQTTITPHTGQRHGNLASTKKLTFTPTSIAAVNWKTLIAADKNDNIWQINLTDVTGNLNFDDPIKLANGWKATTLTSDGYNLYYQSEGHLRSRAITNNKGSAVKINLTSAVDYGSGFNIKNAATVGKNNVIGVDNANGNHLHKYLTNPAKNTWEAGITDKTWSSYTDLASAGNGWFFGKTNDGGMRRFYDPKNKDNTLDDLQFFTPIDDNGWGQLDNITAAPQAFDAN